MRSTRVYGITLVRDERDLIALSLRHHLAIGCERLLVVDNGSTDGTWETLASLSDPRVAVERLESDYHPQAEVFTALVARATREGASWILPFDTDEFWHAPGGDVVRVLGASSDPALRVTRVNYVQARDQVEPASASMLRMTFRADPRVLPGTDGRALVNTGQIAWVEHPLAPKLAIRAAPGLRVGMGGHQIEGLARPAEPTDALILLHAPLRAPSVLEQKAEHGRRVARRPDEGIPTLGWHSKRFARVLAEGRLREEWAANSQLDGCLDLSSGRRPIVPDSTLARALAPHLEGRAV